MLSQGVNGTPTRTVLSQSAFAFQAFQKAFRALRAKVTQLHDLIALDASVVMNMRKHHLLVLQLAETELPRVGQLVARGAVHVS